MKTLITASALVLVSNIASGAGYENQFQTVDLGAGVHDRPVTMLEPMGSSDFTVSLETFYEGNADGYGHAPSQSTGSGPSSSEGIATSLDQFYQDNPDGSGNV